MGVGEVGGKVPKEAALGNLLLGGSPKKSVYVSQGIQALFVFFGWECFWFVGMGFFERKSAATQDEVSNLQRGKKNKNARFVHSPPLDGYRIRFESPLVAF